MGKSVKKVCSKGEQDKQLLNTQLSRLPEHVAIIMDGNGRWAKKRGLPRAAGHRAGMESLREAVELSLELGIRVLSVYAFSTENWKRPQQEVSLLMGLLSEYINKELAQLQKEQVQVRAIGRISELPAVAQREIKRAQNQTLDNEKLILNIALNYGGRSEIVDAVHNIAQLAKDGELDPKEITERTFQRFLYTGDLPDPDLLIRPAGELRISNYLLWQIAYTEFYSTDVFWPDFRKKEFIRALLAYQERKRRFGGLK